ncbi:copper homeostasis periplasmic binding protein CopC [Pseudomonas sp. NPDC090203]|jgi:methionine-rich copper-binding protein CopC|uniref:copper homeostasis periplasmic binding protein CopC n=1 Tax=Pseudomonas TaxID=286 RepID=UPI0023645A1F|nr:copper homeostasis periplasmic binding protein CopC [Pseudomonas putida]MDD1964533.1 copper homeostasis periplasmic binding protein CopC [Pseudomonas putida]
MSAHRVKQALSCLSLLACLTTSSAFAHAHLESQLPAADSEVTSPKELRLNFSEGVEEKFTKVAISLDGPGESTEIIQTQSVATDPANKKVLIVVPAVPLAPGKYKVEWHAVSVDTHKSEGTYRFKVTP